jgi:ribonuclease BN (tRNA processing enzyme)
MSRQHQIMKSPQVRLSRVEAIFITHLHGDHLFGLPGLLCTLSATAGDESRIVTVVGPTGIADYIRSTLLVSFSFLAYKLRVIELVSLPGDVARGVRPCCSATTITVTSDFEAAPAFCLDFTVEQVPAADGVWRLPPVVNRLCVASPHVPDMHGLLYATSQGKDATVSAGGLVHSTPCVGYVIQEPSVAGNLQMAYIKPRLDANACVTSCQCLVVKARIQRCCRGLLWALQ